MATLIQDHSSKITCPICLAAETLALPKGSSQHLYRCQSCKTILRPKSGDCCIFCSFGSVDCSSSEKNLAA
ncbi:MAG: GDCCVxC domain-containing (seleno)protein [Pseudomonadota bacterium]